ncbi:hypothetical protein J6590_094921 [Homalodisca vitripennis]|nr:hypothetical protein J6590_094921 [Homalodisca vitripennis]
MTSGEILKLTRIAIDLPERYTAGQSADRATVIRSDPARWREREGVSRVLEFPREGVPVQLKS